MSEDPSKFCDGKPHTFFDWLERLLKILLFTPQGWIVVLLYTFVIIMGYNIYTTLLT
jgi:hypothetical protein